MNKKLEWKKNKNKKLEWEIKKETKYLLQSSSQYCKNFPIPNFRIRFH